MSKQEYYELLELLIFFATLPDIGFKETKKLVKQLPMPKKLQLSFLTRLTDIRNTIVADVKLTNEEKILIKQSKQSVSNIQ